MIKFAPLHIISGYSFLKSGLTIAKIEKALKKFDYYGMGIADINGLYGFPSFAHLLKKYNKPYLLGASINFEDYFLVCYCKNEQGYRNLIAINKLTQENSLTLDKLNELSKGLIVIVETNKGKFINTFLNNNIDTAFTKSLNNLVRCFDDAYLGIEISNKDEIALANKIREFATHFNYKKIAFPQIRYLEKNDAIVIKIVEAISSGISIKEKEFSGPEYFYSLKTIEKLYSKDEIDNTITIFENINFDIDIHRGKLFNIFPYEQANIILKNKCYDRLKSLNLDHDETYIKRLEYELDIIIKMNYTNYFLLVEDYMNYARTHDILVGAGRGSAAGSLISYLLNITEIDPIKYNLIFERFLNPHRKTMPDIDCDFMDIKRDEVVNYCRNKYGNDKVASIVAFQTIQAKAAIRDIGRVYNYPERHIALLSKAITNPKYSLGQAYKYLTGFKDLVDSDEYFKEIISLAGKIEGLPRQMGTHAAGIIINNSPLNDSCPINEELDDTFVTQYEAKYLEEQGYLKMDFLAIRNLTTTSLCVDLVNQNHQEAKLDKFNIPYDLPEVYSLISTGKNIGLFQIDTTVMKRGIELLKPKCFEDVVALIALNRPGPMAYISNYANRRDKKEKITYLSEDLKPILEPTYGIIIYQEQIMQIAQVFAGFTMAEADNFRRAISKKEKDIMASLKTKFIEGAISLSHTKLVAENVFNHILKFADYGFNRSHSVVYAVLTCRMAYLKAHYPLEFYKSLLQTTISVNDAKFQDYIFEMKTLGIKILSPSVNKSSLEFEIENNSLRFPLTGISYINEITANQIVNERKTNGVFKDYIDFILRMYAYKISDLQISNLIYAGALDEFGLSRTTMIKNLAYVNQYADMSTNEDGQLCIGVVGIEPPKIINEPSDPINDLEKEHEVLKIMLSNSPLTYKKDELKQYNIIPTNELKANTNANVAGIVSNIKIIKTKSGDSMAFMKIFDEMGEIECTLFPKIFSKYTAELQKNKIVVIKGHIENHKEENSLIAEDVTILKEN